MKRSPLRKALALIEDPKRWTQETSARMKDGTSTSAFDPAAVTFCALGACSKTGTYSDLLRHAARLLGYPFVSELNDSSSHATVLSMFDLAIALDEVGE